MKLFEIIAITYIIVVFSIIVQGLTLEHLVNTTYPDLSGTTT